MTQKTSAGSTAKDYDIMPYHSVPYSGSNPNHLAGVGLLFGLTPPDIKTANVLELGCASGGNLLPLACQYPEASFTGVDLSDGQVASGQAAIKALGLSNIQITKGDIATHDFNGQTFDYIIVHGVYSWIPQAARDGMMRIIRDTLSPNGIAYVSYNTYPGWNMRNTVRDICTYHAGSKGSPQERVARARWVLDKIGSQASAHTPYGQMMAMEAQTTKNHADSYILGEFLADENQPCYFHEFAEHAGQHELGFLSETHVSSSIPEQLPEETGKLVREIAGSSGMALEQYMDFFTGRQFRQSLLIKKNSDQATARNLSPQALLNLSLTPTWTKDTENSTVSKEVYKHATGRMSADNAGTIGLMHLLCAIQPNSFTVPQLLNALEEKKLVQNDQHKVDILQVLFKMVLSNAVTIGQQPTVLNAADPDRPALFNLVRYQIEQGQNWISSRAHKPLKFDQGHAPLALLFDGTKTISELLPEAIKLLEKGKISQNGQKVIFEGSDTAKDKAARKVLLDLAQHFNANGIFT